MRITIEDAPLDEEEQIIVKCHQMTPELMRVLSIVKSAGFLIAFDGSEIHRVPPSKVFYIESVDSKTFLYTKEKVLESKLKLYELENSLTGGDFLRVSKSVILNLSKIRSLSPALSGRFEANLENGEKIIISRQYVAQLKRRLGV